MEGFVGKETATEVLIVIRNIEQRLGAWVLGELVLMFFIGLLVFIGLSILQLDYALSLAIIAGMLEIIPNIGPIVSAIPAVIISLATSPILAVTVVIVYIITHQLENNLLVPLVMRKSVGLSPVITIISMLIGGKLAGIPGIILAVPVVLVIQELLSYYFEKLKK
jgi:predicted PurR-regulated permease PerM